MTDDGAAPDEPRGRSARTPSDVPAKGWKDVALRVKGKIGDDNTVLMASGIAFWAFLSLFPGLSALASVLGLLTSPQEATSRAQDLFEPLPEGAQDLLTGQLETLAGATSASLTTGLVVSIALSLWAASAGMSHLMNGINVAYGESDDRNWFVKKALAIALTLGAIVFGAFAVVGLAALPPIVGATGLPGWIQGGLGLLFWPVLAGGFAAGLAVLYRYVPDRAEPRWRWVSVGSVGAVVAWIVASVGFRVYTSNFASYNETYGSLAAVVVLLLWLAITSFAVLLGAHINAETEHQTTVDTTEASEQPIGHRDAVMADTVGASADGASPPGTGQRAGRDTP